MGLSCSLKPVHICIGIVVFSNPARNNTTTTSSKDVTKANNPPEIGCSFQGRCPRIIGDICRKEEPPWQTLDNGNAIRCHINIKELKIQQS